MGYLLCFGFGVKYEYKVKSQRAESKDLEIMVEKEIRAAPLLESNTRILELTNLAELGIDTSHDDLNLAADRFTLGVKKVGEDTIFVGRLNHPFAGGHFAQFLNSVSPFADQNVKDIIDDINLPILAELDYKAGKDAASSKFIFLHEKHLADDRVGPSYKRFAKDHVDSWLRALEFSNGSEVFDRAQKIRSIDSRENVKKELFSDEGNLFDYSRHDFFDMRSALQMLKTDLFILIHEDLFAKGERDEGEIIKAVLKSLTKEDQRKFAILYFVYYKRQILVDLGTHRIISDKRNPNNRIGKGKVKFADNDRDVIISDGKGTKVVVTPKGQSNDKFSWKVIEYQFAEGYEESSLYPVMAWKKDKNGNRSFLTQQEAMPLVKELGLEDGRQGDVKLGEIAVAYFARYITKDWPIRMRLAPLEGVKSKSFRRDDFEQPMKGAQMPGWVAVEQHKAQLLKSEISVLARSEQHLASVSQ